MEHSLSPEIVLFHILPKLPGRSLLRFKCVCKQWLSFLTSPLFCKIHLDHITTTSCHEKALLFLNGSRNYHTMDCEDGFIPMPCRYPFKGHPSFIATTVNGLVLVNISETGGHDFTDMILWNPLTSEYKTISRPIDKKCYEVGSPALELYHTCSDDDYKILSITSDGNVYIYSLKSGSWRKLKSTRFHPERIPYAAAPGADDDDNLLDEKLHFLSTLEWRKIITRLDLKTEKFTKIAVPPSCVGEMKLAVVRGCFQLTVFNRHETWIIEMWQMNGRDGNWMKMVNISYPYDHNSMHLLVKRHRMRLLYLMRNGNFIVYGQKDILKVDPRKKLEDDLCSNPNLVILPQIYIETFVSPNRYIS